MGHIERYAERVLFLKGDVALAPSGGVEPVREVGESSLVLQSMERSRSTSSAADEI